MRPMTWIRVLLVCAVAFAVVACTTTGDPIVAPTPDAGPDAMQPDGAPGSDAAVPDAASSNG